MSRFKPLLLLAVLCGLSLASSSAPAASHDSLPRIEGENFSGEKVVLPDAAQGKVAVLIFGFSKASGAESRAWAAKISADFQSHSAFTLYQLPVLEDVPRLIRGMVISGIRKGVPENARDHFVPLLKGAADIRKLVHFKEPDDAYLVILDRAGEIAGIVHGPPDQDSYKQFRRVIEPLLRSTDR